MDYSQVCIDRRRDHEGRIRGFCDASVRVLLRFHDKAPKHPDAAHRAAPDCLWHVGVPATGVAFYLLYGQLIPISEWITALFPVVRDSHTGGVIAFFVYDVPKVLLLLTGIVFVTGVLRSWFSPKKTRANLAGKRENWGYPLAALLGVLTPFCSCSSAPLFIGFVSAEIPLGVTFSFLIAGPMVGPVGLGLLYGLVGWEIATIYLVFGFTIAAVAGFVMGRMGLERHLQDWVRELNAGPIGDLPEERLTLVDRLKIGLEQVREIGGKIWIWSWVLVGIGIGAAIPGYVPDEMMLRIMGGDTWWYVPAAIDVGVPMYTNAAGVIPIVEAPLGKGAALGTTLAFMMSVIALSQPEMIILKQVLTLRLITIFIAGVASGILATGFLFNFLL
jgi:hypothetical protein